MKWQAMIALALEHWGLLSQCAIWGTLPVDCDLGLTSGWGIVPRPIRYLDELLVIACTPGIPLEWVRAVFGLDKNEEHVLNKAIRERLDERHVRIGRDNAKSIMPKDGREMLGMTPRTYSRVVPHYVRTALLADLRPASGVAAEFGFPLQRVYRWRRTDAFCPLTLTRLAPGGPVVELLGEKCRQLAEPATVGV